MKKCAVLLVILIHLGFPVQAAPHVSYFPKADIGRFFVERFDLASIRSSFGPRRTPGKRTLADFGMKPTRVNDELVEFEESDWFYQFRLLRRGDVNGDGIEDLEVCFVDRALGTANYDSTQSLLVTRYAADGYAVAISFSVDAGCKTLN